MSMFTDPASGGDNVWAQWNMLDVSLEKNEYLLYDLPPRATLPVASRYPRPPPHIAARTAPLSPRPSPEHYRRQAPIRHFERCKLQSPIPLGPDDLVINQSIIILLAFLTTNAVPNSTTTRPHMTHHAQQPSQSHVSRPPSVLSAS
ncbi:hypothetical protein VTI74DRAFT_11017 [Chaetomium olivicolor]